MIERSFSLQGGASSISVLVIIVAAFAIVWGALLGYLISLRARGA